MRGKFIIGNLVMYTLIAFLFLSNTFHLEGCFLRQGRPGIIDIETNEVYDSLAARNRIIQDSLNNVDAIERFRLNNAGNAIQLGPIGVSRVNNYTGNGTSGGSIPGTTYYFTLSYYRMSDNSTPLIKDNNYHLQSVVWDSLRRGNWVGHYETRPISMRFIKEIGSNTNSFSEKPGQVYIPVTTGLYRFAKTTIIVVIVLTLCLFVLLVFVIPVRILKRIATNDFFNRRNVTDLQAMGYFFIGIWAFNSVIPILINLVFSSIIPGEIYLSYAEVLLDNNITLMIGLALFIVARAFERGYRLEKEKAKRIRDEVKEVVSQMYKV